MKSHIKKKKKKKKKKNFLKFQSKQAVNLFLLTRKRTFQSRTGTQYTNRQVTAVTKHPQELVGGLRFFFENVGKE
jgi:hypothetical protein